MTSRFADHLLTGIHADRPVATAVPAGTLYACSTHGLVYQSDGASWATWATVTSSGLTDPMTTRGDIIVRNSSNTTARLAVGSANKFLHTNGTDPAWAAVLPADLDVSADNTTADATTGHHGLLPKLGGGTTNFLRADGTFAAPPASGAMTLLASSVLGSPAASFQFASISGSYNHLHLVLVGRSSTSAAEDYVYLTLNNDSGSNYLKQVSEGSGTSQSNAQSSTAAAPGLASFLGYMTADTATANVPGMIIMEIPLYAGTTFTKIVKGWYGYQFAGAGNNRNGMTVIHYASTSAITQIDLAWSAAGNFKTGSAAYLYGML